MITKALTINSLYLDSVKMMLTSKELRKANGVIDAVAIMATKENKEILAATGMLVSEIASAKESEIVVVVKAIDNEHADLALGHANKLLLAPSQRDDSSEKLPQCVDEAVKVMKGANLCLISVAGKYASGEADKALDAGLHVMLFSDNVSIEEELRLKRKALEKGLLMMGPDCGTAVINGVPLAFANEIATGDIGIVSASGTGLQEVIAGLSHRGRGISQAFGTGGRDGKKEIGGLMLCACMKYLVDDLHTKVIVLIAKTPDKEVQDKLVELIKQTPKWVVVNFLKDISLPEIKNLRYCNSLDETAQVACELLGDGKQAESKMLCSESYPIKPVKGRRYIRGLYSGGTLCFEALQVYARKFGKCPASNIASEEEYKMRDVWHSEGDCFIDMGADDFTVGRPHPMIDYSLRLKKIADESADNEVAVIMLDVVLGYGAHPDPASELVPVIRALPKDLAVVCHVLGTEDDPQIMAEQVNKLIAGGARVFTSHIRAVNHALSIVEAGRR